MTFGRGTKAQKGMVIEMQKIKRRICSVLLAVLAITAAGCGKQPNITELTRRNKTAADIAFPLLSATPVESQIVDAKVSEYLAKEYQQAAQTQDLVMLYRCRKNTEVSADFGVINGRDLDLELVIINRITGVVWSNPENLTEHDTNGNEYLGDNMASSFQMFYAKSDDKQFNKMTLHSATEPLKIDIKELANGISVNYTIMDKKITLPIEYVLEEDSLAVSIPTEGIAEKGDFKIMSVQVLPYFGAAKDTDTGYGFYPDNSGAIHRFSESHAVYYQNFQGAVYGSDPVNMNLSKYDTEQNVYMPVFGMVKGQDAFLARIEKGESDASVIYSPSGYQTNISHGCFELIFRRTYQAGQNNASFVERMQPELLKQERRIVYRFLTGESASYSGMANAYRDYLISNQLITCSVKKDKNLPLFLDLLVGIKEEQMLNDQYHVMTSFEDAQSIFDGYLDAGVTNLIGTLKGWGKNGYLAYPSSYPANRQSGGNSDLQKLANHAANKGYSLVLEENLVDYSKSTNFSNNNIAYEYGSILPIENITADKNLFSPKYIQKLAARTIFPEHRQHGITGLSLERLGNTVYPDYNTKYGSDKKETIAIWQDILKMGSEQFEYVAVNGGNQYVLSNTDAVRGIQIKSSGLPFASADVPFYQMVVHGLVAYTGTPINLYSEYDAQVLKLVEYGCMPSYYLTQESSEKMMYTDFNQLFNSENDYYQEKVIALYQQLNADLKVLQNVYMIKHESIRDNAFRMQYADGTVVLVNYGSSPADADGKTVEANSYLVIKEG